MAETLLKRWNDWSAGVGHPIDEGNPGMHTANKILGLRGELRPAPVATDVTVGADPGHHFQYLFEEPGTTTGSPAFDASSTGGGQTAQTGDFKTVTFSLSHTVSAEDNRLMVVFIFVGAVDDFVGTVRVSEGGSEFTQLGVADGTLGSIDGSIFCLYRINPTAGAGTYIVNVFTTGTGIDVAAVASTWYDVDQNAPFGDIATGKADNDAGPARAAVTSATGELVVTGAMNNNTPQTMTVVNETQIAQKLESDVRGASSYEAGATTVNMDWTLGGASDWIAMGVSLVGAPTLTSYLYAERGKASSSSSTAKVNKVSLANVNFANLEAGQHDLTPLKFPGQPVRYQGFWWFPMGDNQKARRLQVIGEGAVANDTLDPSATALGADHFANLGSQVASTLTHSGNDDGGMRILKVNGDIGTEADWGDVFPVGDRTERSAGIRSLGDLAFVMQIEGLHSFNKFAQARLVFEDFRAWRHAFKNIPIVPWKGGLIMSHPTGLLFWEPGKLPVNVGLNADIGSSVLSPSGPSGLRGGRYHGLSPAGDFLWHIYQPDVSSTTANVMVAYPREDSPYDLVFQQLGTTTLQDADHMLGCFVSVGSRPLSPEYVTPTLWYGNADDLSYVVLGTTASPFRTRADVHVVEAAGDAYMSELLFEQPTDLTRMVVHTQNMVDGDEWQLKFLADGEEEKNLGGPLRGNQRHEIKIDRHGVYRLMVRTNWVTTDTSERPAPSIQRMELYGDPGRDFPSAG